MSNRRIVSFNNTTFASCKTCLSSSQIRSIRRVMSPSRQLLSFRFQESVPSSRSTDWTCGDEFHSSSALFFRSPGPSWHVQLSILERLPRQTDEERLPSPCSVTHHRFTRLTEGSKYKFLSMVSLAFMPTKIASRSM
jgi:hypothetical protein